MLTERATINEAVNALTLDQATLDTLCKIVENGAPAEQCQAIKTLQAWKAPEARAVLVEATRNEDPDVRVDALEALVAMKADDLGGVFLWSLENDPVGDSKTAALRGLKAEDKETAENLVRKLVLDRCDEDVAWEEEAADWDDWLDIQKEAIRAVGRLGLEEAVPDLLKAANDEFGQDVWIEVLAALSELGRPGLMALIDAGQSLSERQRARAAQALVASQDPLAGKALNALSQDQAVDVRIAALETLLERREDLDDARLVQDEAATVRRFVAQKSPTLPTLDLVSLALEDEDAGVKLSAMRRLKERDLSKGQADRLCEYAGTRLRGESEAFIAAIAEALGKSQTKEAFDCLLEIKRLNPKPEILKAVLGAVSNYPGVETLEVLTEAIASKSQMVRLTALAGLTTLTAQDGEIGDNASAVLLLAARGELGPEPEEEAGDKKTDQEEKQFGARAQDDDGGSRNRIKLDREGNIVQPEDADDPVKLSDYRKEGSEEVPSEEVSLAENEQEALAGGVDEEAEGSEVESTNEAEVLEFPKGTLAAILKDDADQAVFEEEKIELSKDDLKFLELAQNTLQKKRVRPDLAPDAVLDVRRVSVRLLADLEHPAFTSVLLECLTARDNELRRTAYVALTNRCANGVGLSETEWEQIGALPPDSYPPARSALLDLLVHAPETLANEKLELALSSREASDQVASLNALAKRGTRPKKLDRFLSTGNRPPRLAALKCACQDGQVGDAVKVVEAAFQESGALGTELARVIADIGRCQLSDAVLGQLASACEKGSFERMIALQILSRTGEITNSA